MVICGVGKARFETGEILRIKPRQELRCRDPIAIDLCFTRALFAPYYAKEGGHCYDPASSFFLKVASRVDGYPDSASFYVDLRQQDKGRRNRELVGLHEAIPGEDDLSHFAHRMDVSDDPVQSAGGATA